MTPYLVGLQGAKALFNTPRPQGDTRENHILFLSDGLPTDERPSKVLAEFQALGTVHLHLVNLRKNQTSQQVAEQTSYQGLRDWFLNGTPGLGWPWARKPGDNDGYAATEAGFSTYRQQLSALPSSLARKDTTVDTTALKGTLSDIMATIQTCP